MLLGKSTGIFVNVFQLPVMSLFPFQYVLSLQGPQLHTDAFLQNSPDQFQALLSDTAVLFRNFPVLYKVGPGCLSFLQVLDGILKTVCGA